MTFAAIAKKVREAISDRKRKALVATIAALFTLLQAATPYVRISAGSGFGVAVQPQSSSRQSAEENLPVLPGVVKLTWESLPWPEAVAVRPASNVVMQVENLTSKQMRVELEFTADDGGQRNEKGKLGEINLGPQATEAVAVDLRSFGLELTALRYSGQLLATARAFLPGEANYHQTISPMLYFHPAGARDPNLFTFYGEHALRERFGYGDFRGLLNQKELEEAGTVTTRVMYGGAGIGANAPLLGDEEDEPEETPSAITTFTQGESKGAAASPPVIVGNYNYCTCIRFLIQTVDSSIGIPNGPNAGGTEDYYQGANNGVPVIARGIAVRMSRGSWSQTYNADPTTGCFNWSHSETGLFNMRVYGYSTDSDKNYVRIHDDPADFSIYPGNTYKMDWFIMPTPGGVNTYDTGSYDSKWTAMAALAFGLYRYHDGLSYKAFHAGIDNTQAAGGSAHFGESNSHITEGRHYLRLGNFGFISTPSTRYKFIVTHELGHAIAALYYGSHEDADDGGEPSVNLSNNSTPNSCGTGDGDGPSYSISTKEWNSVGFREGFAHFISAKIWNTKDSEGAFIWFAQAHDLERYNFGASNNSGGRLENQCCVNDCADSWEGAGTNEDWVRFLWDWYTNASDSCSAQPNKLDMLKLYRQTRLNGGLAKDNYFEKMQAAANDLTHLSSCLRTSRFDSYAAHNGIDNQ